MCTSRSLSCAPHRFAPLCQLLNAAKHASIEAALLCVYVLLGRATLVLIWFLACERITTGSFLLSTFIPRVFLFSFPLFCSSSLCAEIKSHSGLAGTHHHAHLMCFAYPSHTWCVKSAVSSPGRTGVTRSQE